MSSSGIILFILFATTIIGIAGIACYLSYINERRTYASLFNEGFNGGDVDYFLKIKNQYLIGDKKFSVIDLADSVILKRELKVFIGDKDA
ncbi:MAG: hypothetical protein KAS32_06965 [Candidatus Peribacteraceae bacterium]|nr:hypothetical protein [Candidatus Peribacteraceae bacterium]